MTLHSGSTENIYCAGQIWTQSIYVMALHKTTDGGKSWSSHKITSAYGIGQAVAVASHDKNVIYVGGLRSNTGALYKSTDGGQNWTELGNSVFNKFYNNMYDIAIDPVDNNKIYVGCDEGLYRSTDGGISWKKINAYSIKDILIHPEETNKIYAVGYVGVLYSEDRGNNWIDISTDLGVKDTLCLDINPVNDILYVGSNGGSVFQKGVLEEYALVIKAGKGGTTDPEPGSYVYEKGERVTITAIPDSVHIFDRWTGSVTSQDNPITLTMDGDKILKANFKKVLFPPVSLKGKKEMNRSLLLVQYINTLSWEAHPENIGIEKYRIYLSQEGAMHLLGEVGAGTLSYWHVGVEKDAEYTYGICAVNQIGQESDPAFITIR